MKKILAATDYSESSLNAIDYAAELAMHLKANLILFHAFHSPVIISEVPVVMPSLDELEHEHEKALKKIKNRLLKRFGPNLKLEVKAVCGLAADKIIEVATEDNIDLIAVGMKGAGLLAERLIGSTSTSLMQQSKCPVLCIDEKITFKPLKRIVLACDYVELKNSEVINPLKQLIHCFKSKLLILNVVESNTIQPTVTQAVAGLKLEQAVEGINHSFHRVENKDVIEGINTFTRDNAIDLTVMIPRKHNVFQNLFKESTTKRFAFHSETALLTIHE